ncbi:MAG: GNAT family N-acetyltransferase [Actinomycetes bacterium]
MADEHPLTHRVRTAHGDAWQAEGRLREGLGGGAASLPGIRMMASGINQVAWNNGDVTDPAQVDVEAVRAWYADRGVPWGVRVPHGARWPHGRHLFVKRCMALLPRDFAPAASPSLVSLVAAGPGDADAYAATDAEAFGDSVEATTRWIQPHLTTPDALALMAVLDGEPVGVATGIRASGGGGESVGVFGVGVLHGARRRGIGAALSSSVVAWGFEQGADLAWLNPDTDGAARLYGRLGFVEVGGFDVYVDL